MERVKLKQPIMNLEGKPFKDEKKELTYGDMFISLLSAPKEKDEKKMDKYKLAIKCVADEADLDIDERKLLKDLAKDAFLSPVIYGRIHDLLEEVDDEEKEEKPKKGKKSIK